MKLSEIQEFLGQIVPSGSFVPSVINDNGNFVLRKVSPALLGATGPQGVAGAAGATFLSGSGAPASSSGNDNDYYIDTGNGNLYKKESGSWTLISNLRGPTGATGAVGAAGPAGAAGADGADAEPGGSASQVQYHGGGAPAVLAGDAALTFDDTNDELLVNGNVRVGVEVVAYAANVALDMRGKAIQTIAVTGALSLTGTNYGTGRQITIILTDDGSANTLTFDADWTFVGTKPASLTASKTAALTLTDTTGNAGGTGIIAAFSEEE